MKKNRIYIAAVALLALAGCNKEMSSEATGAITVNASIGTATKVVYNGDDASFTAGDQIAVYAWMGSASEVPAQRVVDGVKNAFDGTNWTPEKQMRWKTVTDPHYFLGVYPVKEITDFKADAYTLNPADFTASDLLVATNLGGVKASDGPVALEFDHVMAKLNVNLKFRSQWAGTPDVTSVTVKARKTAAVDYLTKTVTATGDAEAVEIPASATVTGYARSYSSLEVPQTGVREIVVTIDGKEYTYTAQDDIPLESGKYTTLALYVGKDKLELASVSVNNWTEGTILPDGDARTKEAYAYVDMGEVTIGGKTRNLKWATCNIGAENPWDNGGYFAWGETETKSNYIWATYRHGDSFHDFSRYTGHDYATLRDEDDAACQIWGDEWRIPTAEEWTALLDDALYTWEWTDDYLGDGSKHAGQIVTRKSGTGPCSGNSIFLPASGCMSMMDRLFVSDGYYWTSTLDDWSPSIARFIQFSSSSFSKTTAPRYVGYSIRPVLFERYPLPATDAEPMDVGRVLAADGNIYANVAKAAVAGTTAVAMIAYVGSETGSTSYNHGLAIALADASTDGCAWGVKKESDGVSSSVEMKDHKAFLNGIGDTETLVTKYGAGYAAYIAKNYSVAAPAGTSGWFLPSSGQWLKFFGAVGINVADWTDWGYAPVPVGGTANDNWLKTSQLFTAAGGSPLEYLYWSSSEWWKMRAVFAHVHSYNGVIIMHEAKDENKYLVRSFLAF